MHKVMAALNAYWSNAPDGEDKVHSLRQVCTEVRGRFEDVIMQASCKDFG